MMTYELTARGHETVEKSGVAKQVEEKWRELEDEVIHTGPYSDEIVERNKEAFDRLEPGMKAHLKGLLEKGHLEKDDFIINMGLYAENLDLKGMEDLGVPKAEAARAATVYVLSKWHNKRRPGITWYNGGTRNDLRANMDGDLYMTQWEMEGKGLYRRQGQGDAHQLLLPDHSWKNFLISLLKYGEQTGRRLATLDRWDDILFQNKAGDWTIDDRIGNFYSVRQDVHGTFVPEYVEEKKGIYASRLAPLMHGNYGPVCPVIDAEKRLAMCVAGEKGAQSSLTPHVAGYDTVMRVENMRDELSRWKPAIIMDRDDVNLALAGTLAVFASGETRYTPGLVSYIMMESAGTGDGDFAKRYQKSLRGRSPNSAG